MLVALGFGVSMGAATPIVAAVSTVPIVGAASVPIVGAASVTAVGAVMPVVSVIVTGLLPVWVVALTPTPLLLFAFDELDPQALNTSASRINIPKRLRFIVFPSIVYISSNNMYYFHYYRVLSDKKVYSTIRAVKMSTYSFIGNNALLVLLVGAIILLRVVNLIRHGRIA
jgi:hypothetical protein